MCTAICSSILRGMDQCAIRVNRWNQCARKTMGIAAVIFVPVAFFVGGSIAITSVIPAEETQMRRAVTFSALALMFLTEAALTWRYSWLFQRTGSNPTFCLPSSIAPLLEAEATNPALPEAYRAECAQYLAHMNARGLEFAAIEQTAEYRDSMA